MAKSRLELILTVLDQEIQKRKAMNEALTGIVMREGDWNEVREHFNALGHLEGFGPTSFRGVPVSLAELGEEELVIFEGHAPAGGGASEEPPSDQI